MFCFLSSAFFILSFLPSLGKQKKIHFFFFFSFLRFKATQAARAAAARAAAAAGGPSRARAFGAEKRASDAAAGGEGEGGEDATPRVELNRLLHAAANAAASSAPPPPSAASASSPPRPAPASSVALDDALSPSGMGTIPAVRPTAAARASPSKVPFATSSAPAPQPQLSSSSFSSSSLMKTSLDAFASQASSFAASLGLFSSGSAAGADASEKA